MNANFVDELIKQFHAAANSWQDTILNAAGHLFGVLAVISFCFTLTLCISSGFALPGLIRTMVQWLIFNGLAYWSMTNGPTFFEHITDSFYQLGGKAAGADMNYAPTMFLDWSFKTYDLIAQRESLWPGQIGASIKAELIGLGVVLCCAWMTFNLILALVSAWIAATAGTFFLGFGAFEWTRYMAIGYYRLALAIGAKIMVLVLVMGLGYGFLQKAAFLQTQNPTSDDLVMILACVFILALLSHSLPNVVAGIAGSPGGSGPGNLGLGVGLQAAAMTGNAVIRGAQAAGNAMGASLSSVEKAANHADNLRARGIRPTRNGSRGA
jgi:P-type conjugative transfer protein TrbL